MLSILIPIYNFDSSPLLEELAEQSKNIDKPIEIIVYDDHSSIYVEENKNTAQKLNITYKYLERNLGRSMIRNSLARRASNDFLLFLDCDVFPKSRSFIRTYLSQISNNTQVIYGGRTHEIKRAEQNKLRSKYGYYREDKTIEQRNKRPHLSISTNNLLVRKSYFEEILFDESLVTYGHEDTLFAYELKKKQAKILHVDNPVVHENIDENSLFLKKTELALRNLKIIFDAKKIPSTDIKLLRAYKNLKSKKIEGLFNFAFSLFQNKIKKRLISDKNNLFLFEVYKLGYFCKINRK